MPPAISDESDDQETTVPVRSKKNGRERKSINYELKAESEDEEIAESENAGNHGGGDGEINGKEDDEGDDDDEGEEEEYVVEKIASHMINDKGEPLFHVKWEGYEKKSDMTWEPEENLQENASSVLEEYFAKLGGREKLFEETATALRGKKRGRPGSSTPTTNGKKAKKNGHPLDEEAPRTARVEQWRPPAGLWEEHIAQLDAFEDEETGKLMVYLTWKNGHKTQHETSVIYKRCPQKMLQFYERHVRIIKREAEDLPDGDEDEA